MRRKEGGDILQEEGYEMGELQAGKKVCGIGPAYLSAGPEKMGVLAGCL